MSVRSRRRLSPSRFIAPVATLLIMGYFAFHALNGQYGTRAHIVMKLKIEELEAQYDQRKKVRVRLEERVALLAEGTMERDMVDEKIRRQLNMASKDEVVILLK